MKNSISYLAKTSADRTHPIMLPKCGTLLTYGRAEVIKIFFSPFLGNLLKRKIYWLGSFLFMYIIGKMLLTLIHWNFLATVNL